MRGWAFYHHKLGLTVIQRMDSSWIILGPHMDDRKECLTTEEKDEYLSRMNIPVMVSHIHPGGINGEAK